MNSSLPPHSCSIWRGRGVPHRRWHWAAGSIAAAGAVSAGSALGEIVQITQVGNFVSSTNDSLDRDLTGDAMVDLPFLRFREETLRTEAGASEGTYFHSNYLQLASYTGAGGLAAIEQVFGKGRNKYLTVLGSVARSTFTATVSGVGKNDGNSPQSIRGMIPVSFQDERINGNESTNGFLEVLVRNFGRKSHRVDLLRLIFDDASTEAPSGVTPGASRFPEFGGMVDPGAEKAKLKKQIKKLKKQQKAAKRKGKRALAKRLAKKIKKLKATLKQL